MSALPLHIESTESMMSQWDLILPIGVNISGYNIHTMMFTTSVKYSHVAELIHVSTTELFACGAK